MKHRLPGRISSIYELTDFPLLTKRVMQEHHDSIFQNGKIKRYISTGGSTGVPTRFPSSSRDAAPAYADIYVGRSWWGIQPLDEGLVFWGHSHLFGSGWRGRLNGIKRRAADWLVNVRRLNAYDMTPGTVAGYYDIYRRSNPTFLLGYTSCLYKLAKYILENRLDCGRKDRLKAVVATSETVTGSDVDLFHKVFGVPVAIEYGTAETGVIAYSHESTWKLRVLWDSFIVTAGNDRILNVTTISDRVFPLINYRTDDVVDILRETEGSILELRSIQGRKRDVLRIGAVDGSYLEVSGILLVHVLKSYPRLYSIQFEQFEQDTVRILLAADRPLDLPEVKDYFIREVRKDHANIDGNCILMEQVESVSKTLAGKEGLVRARVPHESPVSNS
jgi:phenylacetate-coenzyme A ligase PaaK-like adenylate-forming protein